MKILILTVICITLINNSYGQWVHRSGSLYSRLSEGNEKITKAEFKKMIIELDDQETFKSFENHQLTLGIGTVLFVPGMILCIKSLDKFIEATWDWFISDEEREKLIHQSKVLGVSGLLVATSSIVLLFLSQKSLDNAIDRFNMLKYDSRLRLDISSGQFVMRYRF